MASTLTTLRFRNYEELQEKSKIDKDMEKSFLKLTCDNCFERMTRLASHMRNPATGAEDRFIFAFRICQVGQIAMNKQGFDKFKTGPDGKKFYGLFKDCVQLVEDLSTILKEKYASSEAARAAVVIPVEAPIKKDEPPPPASSQLKGILIRPAQLVRLVESGGQSMQGRAVGQAISGSPQSALLIDFRANTDSKISYRDPNLITVVKVPNDEVTHGCIFTTLIQMAAVSERSRLSQMPDFDYVVLVGDETRGEVDSGQIVKGSKTAILYGAITTYNSNHRPKRDPLVLDGGFTSWLNSYPMYVKSDQPIVTQDDIGDFINKYKRDMTVFSVQYPDVSPVKAKPKPIPVEVPEPRAPSPDQPLPSETTSQIPASTQQPTSTKPLPKVERSTKPLLPVPDVPATSSSSAYEGPRETTSAADTPISRTRRTPTPDSVQEPAAVAVVHPRPEATPSTTWIESKPSQPPVKPSLPTVDRGLKPLNGDATNGTAKPAVLGGHGSAPTPSSYALSEPSSRRPPPPCIDRAAKPSIGLEPMDRDKLLTLYDMVRQALRRQSNMKRDVAPGTVGLFNMGNTCFMNVTLQAFFQVKHLRRVFTREQMCSFVNVTNKLGTHGVFAAAFAALLDEVWEGERDTMRPERFIKLFADEVNSDLVNGREQDAQEFQMCLLDALHEDTNSVRARVSYEQNYEGKCVTDEASDFTYKNRRFAWSPIMETFHTLLLTTLTCNVCGTSSLKFEYVTPLQVELPSASVGQTSLADCLDSYFATLTLSGEESWKCPKCKREQRARKENAIWQTSPVLIVHLKRFSRGYGDFVKNAVSVDFPAGNSDLLCLEKYLHKESPERKARYELFAVTNHRGRLDGGHYWAETRNAKTGEWVQYDDECKRAFGKDIKDRQQSTAYMLYYNRV